MTKRPNVELRWLLLAAACWQLSVAEASAQPRFPRTAETPSVVSVQVDTVPTFARTRLRQIDELLADEQWPQAIDALTDLVRDHGDSLVEASSSQASSNRASSNRASTAQASQQRDGWWITLRAYAGRKIAHGEAAALAEYRRRVDPLVETQYREAVANHDRAALAEIVANWFPSSWSDDALSQLAELALEAGDYGAARAAWQRLLPAEDDTPGELTNRFPDPDFAAADIAARLALTSILEGPASRSERELARFQSRHPDASGTLAGREGRYTAMLSSLSKASGEWPPLERAADWTSFGGSATRQAPMADTIEMGGRRWVRAIDDPAARRTAKTVPRRGPPRAQQIVESPRYFPVTWQDIVLVGSESRIVALNYRTGQPAWGLKRPVIYRTDTKPPTSTTNRARVGMMARMARFRTAGQPRFTLTVVGDRLLARMGPAWTQHPQGIGPTSGASLVCLDLKAQGRLEWKRHVDDTGDWAFEGTPVSDGRRAYVCLRRRGVYPECHVECINMEDGQTVWRRFVCTGRHATSGRVVVSHNLLTLVGDTLYVNTNMGAVAALGTDAGKLRWVRQYRDVHVNGSRTARSASSDPSPCLVSHGRVFVAPDDSDVVLAMDADDGRLIWQAGTRGDITELLGFRTGVKGGELIASGRRLWCLDEASGEAIWRWPPGNDNVHSAGRGIVLDGNVYWPTSDNSIRVFKQDGRDSYWPSQIRLPIVPGQPYAGDLLAAGDILLVTSQNRLLAFGGIRSAADSLPEAKTSSLPEAKTPSLPEAKTSSQPEAKTSRRAAENELSEAR